MTKIVQIPKLRIAKLEKTQSAEAVDFVHRAWHSSYAKHLPANIVQQRTKQHFENHIKTRFSTCWLAWMGKRVVGLTTTASNCVDEVWVSRRFRRQGIATKMIGIACHDLNERGFDFAQAGCEDFNDNAIAMFEALGWQQIGTEPVEIRPGIRHSALVYSRALDRQSEPLSQDL